MRLKLKQNHEDFIVVLICICDKKENAAVDNKILQGMLTLKHPIPVFQENVHVVSGVLF